MRDQRGLPWLEDLARDLKHGLRLVVREMLVPVVAGVVAGLTAAFQLTGFAEKMLFGVTPTDPATLVGSCLMLIGLTITAAWLPGRRAARLNPATTLRGA